MSRLETRNSGPPVPAEFSKTPGLGRAEDASPSTAVLQPSKGAPAGNKAQAVLKCLREKWPPEFRDGARYGFLKEHDGPRDSGAIHKDFSAGRWSAATLGSRGSMWAPMTARAYRKRSQHDRASQLSD